MLWTKTNSLKGLNLGLMNIHQRLSLIGPLAPRGKPIGAAGAGSEEPEQDKGNHKTSGSLFTSQHYYNTTTTHNNNKNYYYYRNYHYYYNHYYYRNNYYYRNYYY